MIKTEGSPPVADFEASHEEVFVWEKVMFTDISTNDPQTWNWTFEGGEPASSEVKNPEVLYSAPGKKEYGIQHWNEPNNYGSNRSGFSARGAGIYLHESPGFTDAGEYTVFWTSTPASERFVWTMALANNNARMAIQNTTERSGLFSVRCIMD